MIVPVQSGRIVVATKPVDFRKGHDGLAAVAEKELGLDPNSGLLIVFRAKRAAGENPAEWEVQVFQSDHLNAFALPGKKIVFYTRHPGPHGQ